MIVLGSAGDSLQFEKPSQLEIQAVVRGEGRRLRHYAIGRSSDPESGASRKVAVTMRRRRRWRVPLSGKPAEVVIWTLPDDSSEALPAVFSEPGSGGSIGWVKSGDLLQELARWRERSGTGGGGRA